MNNGWSNDVSWNKLLDDRKIKDVEKHSRNSVLFMRLTHVVLIMSEFCVVISYFVRLKFYIIDKVINFRILWSRRLLEIVLVSSTVVVTLCSIILRFEISSFGLAIFDNTRFNPIFCLVIIFVSNEFMKLFTILVE